VLLCHPWGPEYIHAYRAVRQLAKLLSAAGLHVMRFDYYGTGDSAGDSAAGDPAAWGQDIRAALAELRDMAETARVSLVGLRLGASLAAEVAAQPESAIESLVLWDPVISGADYLAGLYRAGLTGPLWRKAKARRAAAVGGGYDVLGFPLTDRMALLMRGIDLARLAPALPERTLILASQSPSLPAPRPARCLGPLAVETIADEPAWIEWPVGHPLAGTVPARLLQRIVEWLA
jgi:pimeloyl-ACP methyl ester carboxylesterase